MDLIKYGTQRRLNRKYTRWLYELFNEGKFHELPMANRIKDLPSKDSLQYVEYGKNLEQVSIRYFDRIFHCADVLHGFINPKTKKHIVTSGLFCEKKICPICQTKRALHDYSKLTFQMEELGDEYDYYFLTLTLPNNFNGFREELKLLNICLRDMLCYFRYDSRNKNSACVGCYGSYEITNKGNGWHPHLHCILAYKKGTVSRYESITYFNGYRNRTYCTDMIINEYSEKKQKYIQYHYCHDDILKKWYDVVQKHTDVYSDYAYFDCGFEKVYNVERGRNELSKYLIDYKQAIQTKEDLFVFLRDSYGVKQRVRRGIFIWNDSWEEKYNNLTSQMKLQREIEYFGSILEGKTEILYNQGECVPCVFRWGYCGEYYTAVYTVKAKKKIPWTSSYTIVDLSCIYSLVEDSS